MKKRISSVAKNLFAFLFVISVCFQVCAQKRIFVRVYDLSGSKIGKGFVFNATDTSLQIERGGPDPITLSFHDIGTIKTRRSAGHNLLVGAIAGAAPFAILGALSADPDAKFIRFTAAEGAEVGALLGFALGGIIGGMTALFKNPQTFVIKGDLVRWRAFQQYISTHNTRFSNSIFENTPTATGAHPEDSFLWR